MRALYCTRITKDKNQFMPFAREWDGIQHPRREENTNVVGADTGREDQAGIPHAATPPLSQERALCGASAKRCAPGSSRRSIQAASAIDPLREKV